MLQNFAAKIGGYGTALPLTPAQVTSAVALCNAIIEAINSTEQCRQTMMAVTQWRDAILRSDEKGMPAPPPPVFPVLPDTPQTLGSMRKFVELRDLIVASPGYTTAIGEDLGIVGAAASRPSPEAMTPELKSISTTGYTVNLVTVMRGMDAVRLEYAPKGGAFRTVGFFTNPRGSVHIDPVKPGEPETGHLRAIYMKSNVPVGNFSAEYPVTVS